MVAQKRTAPADKPAPLVSPQQEKRKPWVKKTPVEIVLDQATKLREQIEAKEAELAAMKKQLEKFDAARKLFESP